MGKSWNFVSPEKWAPCVCQWCSNHWVSMERGQAEMLADWHSRLHSTVFKYGLFPLPDSDSDSHTDSYTMQNFSIGWICDSFAFQLSKLFFYWNCNVASYYDPLIEMYVLEMEICPWNRDLPQKWVQYPFGKGIQIWIRVSGDTSRTVLLCSHRVWSSSPNLQAVEISHYNEGCCRNSMARPLPPIERFTVVNTITRSG